MRYIKNLLALLFWLIIYIPTSIFVWVILFKNTFSRKGRK